MLVWRSPRGNKNTQISDLTSEFSSLPQNILTLRQHVTGRNRTLMQFTNGAEQSTWQKTYFIQKRFQFTTRAHVKVLLEILWFDNPQRWIHPRTCKAWAENWSNRRKGTLPGWGQNRQVRNRQDRCWEISLRINTERSAMSTKESRKHRVQDRGFKCLRKENVCQIVQTIREKTQVSTKK